MIVKRTSKFHRPRRKNLATARLSAEPLESRCMMATFMVTNLADSGPGSLRDAIGQANQGTLADTIEFESGLAGGTIALQSYLAVTESVTIDGLGADQLTLDGQGNERIFHIDNSDYSKIDVTLNGLTITGGYSYYPAGISSRENLTITNCHIHGNTSVAGPGGIFHGFGDLNISDSTISNNRTLGEFARGAGIYLLTDTAVITDTTIAGNQTGGAAAKGGGIYSGASDLTLVRTTVTGNTAAADGGGISQVAGTLSIVDSTISSNTSGGTGGGAAVASGGSLTMTASLVSDNNATTDGGGINVGPESSANVSLSTISGNATGEDGGGLHARESVFTMDRSSILANSAGDHGGGIALYEHSSQISNSVIAMNNAFRSGGGVYSRGGDMGLANSTVSGNRAFTSYGGGIWNLASTVHIQNSTITQNTAPTGMGSGIHAWGDYLPQYTANTLVHSSIIAGNTGSDFDRRGALSAPTSLGFNVVGFGDAVVEFDFFDITGVADPGLLPLADKGGPTQTHALLPGSIAIDNGANADVLEFDQRGAPFDRDVGLQADAGAFELQNLQVDGDFDDDGDYSCADIDALVVEIVAGTNNPLFDLTGDAIVDSVDLDAWLAEAGAAELPSGNPYPVGDANLDGTVDGLDFIQWNSNKFTSTAAWCAGDFNADGTVDGLDFILWNENKFTSADTGLFDSGAGEDYQDQHARDPVFAADRLRPSTSGEPTPMMLSRAARFAAINGRQPNELFSVSRRATHTNLRVSATWVGSSPDSNAEVSQRGHPSLTISRLV